MAQDKCLTVANCQCPEDLTTTFTGAVIFLDDVSRPAVFARQKHWSGRMILLWLRWCPCWKLCAVLVFFAVEYVDQKNHRSITLMTEWTHHASPVLPMSNLNCLCDRIIHPPGIARVMTPGRLRAHRLGYDLFPPEMLKPHGSSMLSFFSARGGHFPRLDLQNWLLFFTWHDWLILSGWVITTNHLT